MKFVVHFFALGLATILTSATETEKHFLHFGDTCDVHQQHPGGNGVCDPNLNLWCSGNVCMCKERYVYDKTRDFCLGGHGATCTPQSTASEKSPCAKDFTCQPEPSNTEKIGVPSILAQTLSKIYTKYGMSHPLRQTASYTCRCPKGFEYAVVKGKQKCRAVKGIGATCVKNAKPDDLRCDPAAHLICGANQTCICPTSPDSMTYNKEIGRCATPLGSNCENSGENNLCGKNAVCSRLLGITLERLLSYRIISKLSLDLDTMFHPAQCMCAPGFAPTAEGECAGGYEVPCSKASDCNGDRFLTCINGACQCQMPSGSSYSTADEKCKIHAGYSCSLKSGAGCIENAVCKKDHCECKDGFTETGDGRCLASHGSKCDMGAGPDGLKCNHYQGLACTGPTCACFDPQLNWNPKTKICESKAGKFCGRFMFKRLPALEEDPLYPFGNSTGMVYLVGCEDGLTCVKNQYDPDLHYCQKHK